MEEAEHQYGEQACLQELIVALSGLRALGYIDSHGDRNRNSQATTALWERALHFGPMNLQRTYVWHTSMPLLKNMMGWIRAEAIRRLLREHEGETCLSILCKALDWEDRAVALSAIDGLQIWGIAAPCPHWKL